MSKQRLEGKVAVITGGGGGIGSAAGRIFCEEGAKVALVDRDPSVVDATAKEIRRQVAGAEVMGLVADVGQESAAQTVVDAVLRNFGGIDVLVNNVGIRRYETLADAPWDAWDDILRVNLLSFVSMARAALPALRRSGRGSIINVSSTGAVFGRKGMGAYDASKAAVLALTRTMAFEEAEHGIRVNTICPGYTRTPFHENRLGSEKVDALVPPCVLQRWGTPSELAYPMLWLASDEASYVTAATFMIDGGFPAEGSGTAVRSAT
ncbi:SDR family oxidoreductase [Roseomonas gilardii]|uniref:SDR family oxidoreductase n=1 Tax=Roseomonas gilardii TaxID=257708 RepID=A0ABU3MIR1_9PROT|nr:SDR family oxidoreductase [Roseomonas gilardii]MDT8332889.1 SDR family oxidoreductase [Roseomonas gilardii]